MTKETSEKSNKVAYAEEATCPFIDQCVENAYGDEVHLFLHTHLRGYDKTGEGLVLDSSYYDKYGAPVQIENSWLEGYHAVERQIGKHFNHCINTETDFPLVAGVGGGAHLYNSIHKEEPWNWTGWVPRHKRWLCESRFFNNRHFMTLRGNEIQNNLWDYHPHEEEEGALEDDKEYVQISPVDKYKGGYLYEGDTKGRYLHVISLKSHVKQDDGFCKRFNFIVHPLAYRSAIDLLPDNTVDGIQWSVMNICEEKHFKDKATWGDKFHGIEIFNDFTYYNSWNPSQTMYGIEVYNGEEMWHDYSDKKKYITWFDTYPLEYCLFLLDTALMRGCYLHPIAANDAFYTRKTLPPRHDHSEEDKEKSRILYADPKGKIVRTPKSNVNPNQNTSLYNTKARRREKEARNNSKIKKSMQFMKLQPYKNDTAFGHTTLVDTTHQLKKIACTNNDLDSAELLALDKLCTGQFFAHTGVYDIFDYGNKNGQIIPFIIKNQKNEKEICYEITEEMELSFTFPRCKENKTQLIWSYVLQKETESGEIETVRGYFMLRDIKPTIVDLTNYNKKQVKWLRFVAFHPDSPQKRAWFSPVRCLAFGKPKCNDVMPRLTNCIVQVEEVNDCNHSVDIEKEKGVFTAYACNSGDLQFFFDTCTDRQEKNIYSYYLQVYPHQQDTTLPGTKNSGPQPPRILQNVHGFFELNDDRPTLLNLSHSWDKDTVVDGKVYFYTIDTYSASCIDVAPIPRVGLPEGYE